MHKYHIEHLLEAYLEDGDVPNYSDLVKCLEETIALEYLTKQCRTITNEYHAE